MVGYNKISYQVGAKYGQFLNSDTRNAYLESNQLTNTEVFAPVKEEIYLIF